MRQRNIRRDHDIAALRPLRDPIVGDVRSLVSDANRAFIVAKEDEPGLAAALHRLATNPALRQTIGLANRIRARGEFDEGRMIERYRELYGNATASKR